jgi:hypothetical protein
MILCAERKKMNDTKEMAKKTKNRWKEMHDVMHVTRRHA